LAKKVATVKEWLIVIALLISHKEFTVDPCTVVVVDKKACHEYSENFHILEG
jgi:hypothetical protein